MKKYIYSALNNSFFDLSLKEVYIKSGWDLSDAVSVNESTFITYTGQPPAGKIRIPGIDGMPSWGDAPIPSNSELLSSNLSSLAEVYKVDIYNLNTAYLAAIVSDGPSEATKQQIVRDQIIQRKAQYVAEVAAAKEKYPV